MENLSRLNYTIRDDDSTIEEIRNREKYFGYLETKPLQYDESYIPFYSSILENRKILSAFKYSSGIVRKKYVKDSIKLYEELEIGLHDILFAKADYEDDDIRYIIFSNPADIPISYARYSNGMVHYYLMGYKNKDLTKRYIVFEEIVLPIINSKVAASIYAHEIAHTQLIGVGRGYHSLLNEEVIPNFMSQVAAVKMDQSMRTLHNVRYSDLLIVGKHLRALNTSSNLSFASKVENDTFIQSALESMCLADTYFDSSTSVQKEMLKDVRAIFSGESFTEDMLDKYEAHLECVPKDVKVYLKR